jgi:adenylate kinase
MKHKTAHQTKAYMILVTGTPGTGKTTISKSLARQLHANYLSLTQLVFDKKLHADFDRQRRTRVVDLDRARAWLKSSLHKSKTITVLDTHISDAAPREYVWKIIVLRCNPILLEARLRRKRWAATKVRENVIAEILDSCYTTAIQYYGSKNICQLDTSRAGVRKNVAQCIALLKRKNPVIRRIDWISVLEKDQALERFML